MSAGLKVFLIVVAFSQFVFAFPNYNLKKIRKEFIKITGNDFEIVKDYVNQRPAARGGETFWLVHVKPKKSGHYALKYTYQYTHKRSHPEEGENELFIRVGAKNCSRYNVNNLGLGNICLGDTIIVPIRLDQRKGHQFSLKSTYQDGESIGKSEKTQIPGFTDILPTINQIEDHLKYLGTVRSEMPHRNFGAQTVTYTAYFEAKKPGKFNFTTTTVADGEKLADSSKLNPLDAMPVIILEPQKSITALTYHENTINYSDNKRFSGHAGNDFLTNILILEPGDIFSVEYSRYVEREGVKNNLSMPKMPTVSNHKLVMYKLPFAVNRDWSYNEWLIKYLPK